MSNNESSQLNSEQFDPDRWVEATEQTRGEGEVQVEDDAKQAVLDHLDATRNADLRELIEEWRDRGVVDPYGMTWHPPADELEELIEDE